MELKLFDKSVYIDRRKKLADRLAHDGIILLLGNELSSMNYTDNHFPFRQDSSFLYYFGIDVPSLAGIIDTDSGEQIIFGNELSIDDIIWTGNLPSVKQMAEMVGISQTQPLSAIEQHVQKAKAAGRKIHILPPYRPENKIKLASWFHTTPQQVSELASLKLIKSVIDQRAIKSAIEIEEMEKAVDISIDMQTAVIQHARPGIKEYQLVAVANEVAIAANGRLGYPAIITTRGQVLHNHEYGHTLQEGGMLLLDIGAENELHYCGDLTRTVPVGKKFTTRQREMYEVVLNSLDHAISLLKPGIRYKEIHLEACRKLVEGLIELKLMKGDPAECVAAGAHTMFFQCGLGHMLGMDVHDMEDLGEEFVGYTDVLKKEKVFGLKSLRLGRELQEGFVLTVEPGIYIIPELIDRWQAEKKYTDFINYDVLNTYRDFGGIRIEDNFAITATGYRLLGKHLPKKAEEVEAMK